MNEETTVTLPRYRSPGFYFITALSLIIGGIVWAIVAHGVNVTQRVNVIDYYEGYMYQYKCTAIPTPGETPRWEFEEMNAKYWPEHAVLTQAVDGENTIWTLTTTKEGASKTQIRTVVRVDAPDGSSTVTMDGEEQIYASKAVTNIGRVVEAVERLNQTAKRPGRLYGFLSMLGVLALGQVICFLRWKKACRYAAAEE